MVFNYDQFSCNCFFLRCLLILFWLNLHKYEAKTVRVIILQRFRFIDFIRKKIIAIKTGHETTKGKEYV